MINIIGLGSTDYKDMTLRAVEMIKNGNKNYLRTKEHATLKYFEKENIPYESFDYLYVREKSFDEVYEKIVEFLIEKNKEEDLNYIVPGNPLIAEKTVMMLLDKTEDVNIVMGMSFIEPLLKAVKIDPSKNMKLLDGDDFSAFDIDVNSNMIITQIYNHRIAVDLKLALGEIYGDDYEIFLVTNAGNEDERVHKIPIYQLDRTDDINHQSALFIPRKEKGVTIGKIIKKLEDSREFSDVRFDERILDDIAENTIELLKTMYELNREGYYYYYEILEYIYIKIGKNRQIE
ncbi:putative tetrapyrrole methylase family protein/MazG family protein [Peptoniphilus sp. ING2-D1G]|nr:putative tetrapyrrole methylase family protein/MazG family protein [Peptoniphilus sp. ING2-D1G]